MTSLSLAYASLLFVDTRFVVLTLLLLTVPVLCYAVQTHCCLLLLLSSALAASICRCWSTQLVCTRCGSIKTCNHVHTAADVEANEQSHVTTTTAAGRGGRLSNSKSRCSFIAYSQALLSNSKLCLPPCR
jgi:hypothetical protein